MVEQSEKRWGWVNGLVERLLQAVEHQTINRAAQHCPWADGRCVCGVRVWEDGQDPVVKWGEHLRAALSERETQKCQCAQCVMFAEAEQKEMCHADCGTKLIDGFCPKCKFIPDMQSLELRTQLPPNIKDLLSRVNKLRALLYDPHPGLMTWREAYQEAAKNLLNFYKDEKQ